ncbi:MAG TPA: aminotransferase class I/II-fold pyridoxal phosphate-dependent enzyme, partial [Candidatus Omnitrophota bacterium]|nr:aminotransferase class I/II-fold pyridoxal phosphate-dependent enzyme [Candidatus Omnitrophota bacterium]
MDLIFEKSIEGRRGYSLPESDVPSAKPLAAKYVRPQSPTLPEVGELDVVRHFMALSRRNFSVDGNFYPLGSCTMKYNPRFTEVLAAMSGLADLHPLLPQLASGDRLVQGALAILYEMEQLLCEITGFSAFTLQPLAGAHGELTGAMMIAAYHKAKKNRKKYIIAPDSAHGTNPASAAIAGFQTITIPSTEEGVMDLAALERALTDEVAGIMLTCPDTAGIFNRDIDKIAQMVHKVDGLMYYESTRDTASHFF